MKKLVKIMSMLMVAIMIVSTSTVVLGAPDPGSYTGNGSLETGAITNAGQNIIQVVATIGSIASVIVLVILGLKYMMGSAEEKAEYKKTLLPYVIGAVMVFAATTIASIIFNVANSWSI